MDITYFKMYNKMNFEKMKIYKCIQGCLYENEEEYCYQGICDVDEETYIRICENKYLTDTSVKYKTTKINFSEIPIVL